MNEKYRIVVDDGHGGVDSGAVLGNLQEKDFNLQELITCTIALKN